MNINKGMIRWTVSKGRETYGYNVVTLLDADTGKKYKAMGGGYDMTGTVFADWIEDIYQEQLKAIADRAHNKAYYISGGTKSGKCIQRKETTENGLYGMRAYFDEGTVYKVVLDGACGLESIIDICKAAGLDVEKSYDRSKRNPQLIAFYVYPKE